jgi:hypothetical protein
MENEVASVEASGSEPQRAVTMFASAISGSRRSKRRPLIARYLLASTAGGTRKHKAACGGRLLSIILLLLFATTARAQYYDWGQDPASTKWRTIKTRDIKYIFPKEYERQAARVMNYMDTIRPYVSFGYRLGPMRRTPLVMHTRNFQGNGIVMLAPRRIELVTTPPGAGQFAFPWLKQLSVHEYRHAVQYNNLNQGLIHPLMWLLGQQGEMVGLAFMPVWAMEGDAVMTETQMSSFGRGLQPSFSMEYRAMLLEGPRPKRLDTWFSGSFRRHLPDHYQMGYQIMSWSWGRYGENILDKTSWFTSRNPWMIFPFTIALKKFYGTSTGRMLTQAFDDLERHWRALPLEDNSATIIETPRTSYTTYTSPRAVEGGIVALKEDLDKTSRLVIIKESTPSGQHPLQTEHTLCRTGIVNSPLALLGSRVYWAEVRRSTLWEQKTGSVLCSYDLGTGRKRVHSEHRNILYPTAAGDTLAWAEYHREGFYSIAGHALPDTISVHGLAAEGGKLYFIGLNDDGMWIGSVDKNGIEQITRPSRVTISDLSSGDGALWFGSIASGRDEIHKLDLATGKEYRATTSRYGSFAASPAPDGIVMTTYTPDGYLLSRQGSHDLVEVPYSELPRNIFNPVHTDWDVPNLDHIIVSAQTQRPVKKYRRGLHLFNFHSWAPLYFEPDKVMGEAQFMPEIGVTAMSQNNLNSAYTELGYGHARGYNTVRTKFSYHGWAPKIEIDARWADTPQLYYGKPPATPENNNHLEITTFAYLPLMLSSGAVTRSLVPLMQWRYLNARLYEDGTTNYTTGTHQLTAGAQYTAARRMAYRDFVPRLGYSLRAYHTLNPLNDGFWRLWRFAGSVRLPGIGPHHGILLQGALQKQKAEKYASRAKELFPRGADYNAVCPEHYRAASVDYALPLAYPDGGINSLIYIRRIRIALGFDYANYKNFRTAANLNPQWQELWSYGADLTFDIAPLRLPQGNNATLTLSLRKASDSNRPWKGFAISLPI